MATTRPFDILGNVYSDIDNIKKILNNANEIKKMYDKTDFNNTADVRKLVKATKEMIDNLEIKATNIHAYFKNNYSSLLQDVSSLELNGEAPGHKEKDHQMGNGKLAEVNSTNIENSTGRDNDNVIASTDEVVDKQTEAAKSKENALEESDEKKVFLKCVDISKLINPSILPHFDTSKSSSKKNNDPVFIILDSDSDDGTPKTATRKRKIISKCEPVQKTVAKKTNLKKDSRAPSLDSEHSNTKTRLSRNAKKRKISYVNPSSSDFSSLSDFDSDEDIPISKSKSKRKTRQVFKEEKLLNAQSDKKFGYKAYVRLERISCEKLKENYLKEKERREIKRLTDLKSLKKIHSLSPSSQQNNLNMVDSDIQSKRKRKHNTKNIDRAEGDLLSDSSEISGILDVAVQEHVEPSQIDHPSKDLDNNVVELVLDAINSELLDTRKSDDDSDHNEESSQKDKEQNKEGESIPTEVEGNSRNDKSSKEKETVDDANKEKDGESKSNDGKAVDEEDISKKSCEEEIMEDDNNTEENLIKSKAKETEYGNDNGDDKNSKKKEESENDSEDDTKKKSKNKGVKENDGVSEDDEKKNSKNKDTSEDESDGEDKRKRLKKKDTSEDDSNNEDNEKKKSKREDTSEDESGSEHNKKLQKKDSSENESVSEDNKKKKSKKKDTSGEETDSENTKKTKNQKRRTHSTSTDDSSENNKKKPREKKKHSSSSSDSDSSSQNREKSSKRKGETSSESKSDSDHHKKKKSKEKSNWRRDRLLNEKLSETDSEAEFDRYKRKHEKNKQEAKHRYCKKKTKIIASDSDEKSKDSADSEDESSSSSETAEVAEKEKANKQRRRIKRVQDSSEDDEDGKKSTRKTIRKVIAHESLAESTKRAEKDEKERKARILERQKKYNQIFELPQDSKLEKLVLDFDEDSKSELLSVNKKLVQKLKPHQGKGVQFMWDTCYESVERANSTEGSGCILAHCMGLGKTLQVIALTHTLLTNSQKVGVKKVLVVCPLSTVLNWEAEYQQWLSDVDGEEINVYELVSCKNNLREFVVDDWHKDGGVLIIGYDMFRNLTNPTNKRLKKRARESFQRGLVNPGPDLVICDEGHLLKNEKTNLSIAMNRIRTARRIVLTGTPMQNNLKEYYCMVQFVKPNLLGTYKEYINRFVNPITNGQYTDSTQHDINIMRKRSHVLHTMLDGIVQRRDYSVLTPYLPPKYEYVLFLKLTPVQIKLYQHYKNNFSQTPSDGKIKSSFLFRDFQEFQRICTHPRVLLMKSREDQSKDITTDEDSEGSLKDFIDDKSEKSTSSTSSSSDSDSSSSSKSRSNTKVNNSRKRVTRTAAASLGIDVEVIEDDTSSHGWWSQYCNEKELEQIELSSKLYLLFKIIEECDLAGDKILVFSQSLLSLNIIEYFLAKIDEATQQGDNSKVCDFSGSWTLGLDYFRLDGSSSCDNRKNCCKLFNDIDNQRARLFLISTRAGGLGINLVGANRVIIFDASWNPSHDTQSIYRVYRFGQTKPCYIYRFVVWGTMEMKIYERQVTKQAISKRVIDEQQIDRHYNQNDLAELYLFDPEPTDDIIPLVPKDVLLGELLQKEKDRIYKYHEHQSLLENKEDEELNEAERKAAWEEFENEKTARVVNTGSLGWIKNLPITSITIALRNIVQRDNPSWPIEQVTGVIPSIVQQLRTQVEAGKLLLFQRIVDELRNMQVNQQQNYQVYLKNQQQYQQQQQQQQMNILRQHLRQQMFPQLNSNEIVELND